MEAVSEEPSSKKRILVVDDHPVVREACKAMIRRQSDLTCCGEACSTTETQKAVRVLQPDLVLLDLSLGSGDGLELIKSLKAQLPSMRILVFSQCDEALYVERVLRAGALGYITKNQGVKEVLTAIRTVLAGEVYVSPSVAAWLLHKVAECKRESRPGKIENLTDRELNVLQLLGAGMSTRKIADVLGLSFKTVESHRENIKRKLGLRDAVELVRFGAEWVRGQTFSSSREITEPAAEPAH